MKAVITAFARIRESIVGMAGLAIVLFWVLVAVFADIISPFDPLQQISPLATPGTEVEGGVLILGATFWGVIFFRVLFTAHARLCCGRLWRRGRR